MSETLTLSKEQIEEWRDELADEYQTNRLAVKELTALCNMALGYIEMQPRPISEAPKDGSEILAWWDGAWVKTYWVKRNGFEGWQMPAGFVVKVYDKTAWFPTHFIPLSALQEPKE